MKKFLAIYRAYGGEASPETFKSFRPRWFDKKKCWASFYYAFKNAKIIVLWDGEKSGELYNYIKEFDVEIISNEISGNNTSFLKCLDIGRSAQEEYIFFSEDDYLYQPYSIPILEDLLSISPIATLYDHKDRYTLMGESDITYGQERIFLGRYSHIRTVESTCCSFGVQRNFLVNNFEQFCKFSPANENAPRDREMWRSFIRMGYRLVCPLRGGATHLVSGLESPYVDWEKFSGDIKL